MTQSPLFEMQAPQGVPLSAEVEAVNDPLLPPQAMQEMLAHFHESVYDTDSESHISRLLGVLLGDTGVSQLRKKATYAHLSRVLHTAHFYALDRFFADIFGLKRFLSEGLVFDPEVEGGTSEEWEAVLAADAAYKSRVAQFVRGINLGPTPAGIQLMASAVIGSRVRVYETFRFIDGEQTVATDSDDSEVTYSELESYFYSELDQRIYGSLEGGAGSTPGASGVHYSGTGTRTHFVIRPLREITNEERYHLIRVLNRVKPVGSMFSVDISGPQATTTVPISGAYSPSTYWHIRRTVTPSSENSGLYEVPESGAEQPAGAFSRYQGEEWFYNSDVIGVEAYSQLLRDRHEKHNYERIVYRGGSVVDYMPQDALADHADLMRGRAAREGVLSVNLMEGG